jgi:hypothetical protein
MVNYQQDHITGSYSITLNGKIQPFGAIFYTSKNRDSLPAIRKAVALMNEGVERGYHYVDIAGGSYKGQVKGYRVYLTHCSLIATFTEVIKKGSLQ